MTNTLEFNVSQNLMLENLIRVSSNSAFNSKDAYDNTFNDLISEKVISEDKEKKEQNQINFSNLGMPYGFQIDTSLIEGEFSL